MTPTEHEKSEWCRMACAAYLAGQTRIAHAYMRASCLPAGSTMDCRRFDWLQDGYRAWLVFGHWPTPRMGG